MFLRPRNMRLYVFLVVSLLLLSAVAYSAAPATMRLDYYHTGNATAEMFGLDRVVIEPLPWPGDMAKTIDNSNLGNYFFEVREQASGRLLYSRGFGSLFSEWSQTEEAKKLNRTFSESLRFPAPTAPVKIILQERKEGKEVSFHEVWSTTIDPKDKFIDRVNPPSPGPLITIQKMGEPATKVDLLISVMDIPQPSVASSNKMPSGPPRSCSHVRHSANIGRTSTFGRYVRQPSNRASRGLRQVCIATRPLARRTTRSTASVTS